MDYQTDLTSEDIDEGKTNDGLEQQIQDNDQNGRGTSNDNTKQEANSDVKPKDNCGEQCGNEVSSHFKGRTDFTSEIFKIEISNLPRRFGYSQLKKRLSSTLGLHPHKIKALPNKTFAFVCFSCEEDREAAIEAITGHEWKGRKLTAKKAQPSADPLKRKLESKDDENEDNKRQKMDDALANLPPNIRLKCSLMPLWEMPYNEQLQLKTDNLKAVLRSVANIGDVRRTFEKAREENDGMCCPLLPAVSSPILDNYRNKSEFSIGRSESGDETIVGFRFGLYKNGNDCVGSPIDVDIISPAMKLIVQHFQDYLHTSKYAAFDHRTHVGHWRQLTVRTTQNSGGTMAIAEFVVQQTTAEEREAEKEAICNYFTQGLGQAADITTFFFRPCSNRTSDSNSGEPYELIYGSGYVFESLLGMKFRISPNAFFQINTMAAEVLYKLIAEWSCISSSTTVLDLCCGTGTIGLSMAKSVAKVIGVELCKEAIEDAEINAQLNGVTNCRYSCARVQDVIQDIIHTLANPDVVAVLDPPRGGIHPVVIRALRTCRQVKRIVYAACNPVHAKFNFVDLVRPQSRKTRGAPFVMKKAMPVDMFPHTRHCELLVLFERDL